MQVQNEAAQFSGYLAVKLHSNRISAAAQPQAVCRFSSCLRGFCTDTTDTMASSHSRKEEEEASVSASNFECESARDKSLECR